MPEEPVAALRPWRRHAEAIAWARTLQRLPGRQRAALLLHDSYGFATADVAEMLDTTPAVVETMLTGARCALARDPPTLRRSP